MFLKILILIIIVFLSGLTGSTKYFTKMHSKKTMSGRLSRILTNLPVKISQLKIPIRRSD
ncbi:MAG: hypothetical protein IPM38_04785 [Ignavibacteria bacterium]|nr:hypothetical protein [Ignavibacteria bacterium]